MMIDDILIKTYLSILNEDSSEKKKKINKFGTMDFYFAENTCKRKLPHSINTNLENINSDIKTSHDMKNATIDDFCELIEDLLSKLETVNFASIP